MQLSTPVANSYESYKRTAPIEIPAVPDLHMPANSETSPLPMKISPQLKYRMWTSPLGHSFQTLTGKYLIKDRKLHSPVLQQIF